jgi:hypothetical protein
MQVSNQLGDFRHLTVYNVKYSYVYMLIAFVYGMWYEVCICLFHLVVSHEWHIVDSEFGKSANSTINFLICQNKPCWCFQVCCSGGFLLFSTPQNNATP